MSQNITQPTKANVKAFLQAVLPKEKQKDSFRLYALIKKIQGKKGCIGVIQLLVLENIITNIKVAEKAIGF